MSESIFRKKSIDKVSSPEELNDYIHVANPGVWLVLGAIIILLAGICIWGIFGSLDTTFEIAGNCKDGTLTCYVLRENLGEIKEGLEVIVEGEKYIITKVSKDAVKVEDSVDEHLAYMSGFAGNDWVYGFTAETNLPDGNYDAKIITESVSPVSFVLN